jgi:hypothetical protein
MSDSTAGMEARLAIAEHGLERLSVQVARMDVDIVDIKTRLATTATKDDVNNLKLDIANISSKIDSTFNGLLRDALNAVPQRTTHFLMGAAIVISVISVAATIVFGVLHH